MVAYLRKFVQINKATACLEFSFSCCPIYVMCKQNRTMRVKYFVLSYLFEYLKSVYGEWLIS